MRTIAERNVLVEDNQKLLSHIAQKLRVNPVVRRTDHNDLVGAGQFGLLSAAEDWDEAKGTFATHAWFRVLAQMQEAARLAFAVTLPRTVIVGKKEISWRIATLGDRQYTLRARAEACPVEREDTRQYVHWLMQHLLRLPGGRRQHQILTLILKGWTQKRIAARLGVSSTQVGDDYRQSLARMRKMVEATA